MILCDFGKSSDNSNNSHDATNERLLQEGDRVWFPSRDRKAVGTGTIVKVNDRASPQLMIERETRDGLGKYVIGVIFTRNMEKCH